MNYKEAYCYMWCQLVPLIERLEQHEPACTPADAATMLRRLQVECEEIRIGQGLGTVHRAPRSGSSKTVKV